MQDNHPKTNRQTTTQTALNDLEIKIQLLLIYSEAPITSDKIYTYLAISESDFKLAIASLSNKLQAQGLDIKEVKSGWKIELAAEYQDFVSGFNNEQTVSLTRTTLEVLAIIASRQPITRAEIEQLRGVSMGSEIIRNLKGMGYIQTRGNKEVPGKPKLWVTTNKLLDDLDFNSNKQLQKLCIEAEQNQLDFD